MRIEISEATGRDVEEISALSIQTYVGAFGADFAPDDLAHHLAQTLSVERWNAYFSRDRVLVARRGSDALGYIQFGPSDDGRGVEIRRVYVLAAAQNQSIGTQLLQAALASPECRMATTLYVDVREAMRAPGGSTSGLALHIMERRNPFG